MGLSNSVRNAILALFLLLVLFGEYKLWSAGVDHGSAKVTKLWNQDKEKQAKSLQDAKDRNALLMADNRNLSEKLTHDLAEQKTAHEVELAHVKSDYDSRLLQSEKRAGVYKRMSEAGSTECGNLASHTAELDRSLEQGRSLVRELRETLRFRDEQLKTVSAKLLADRKLLTNSDDADGRQNSTSHK